MVTKLNRKDGAEEGEGGRKGEVEREGQGERMRENEGERGGGQKQRERGS